MPRGDLADVLAGRQHGEASVACAVVAVAPRIGAPVVNLWLLGITLNLLLIPGYDDVALRDAGLLMAALASGVCPPSTARGLHRPGAALYGRPTAA